MLRLVQLKGLGGRKPHQISGGQRQRVALARSLAKAPKLLLLDEPLGALDRKLREETQFELMDIQEKLGTTFVIVTHDQEEAMTVASRVAVMDEGRIVQVDTPGDANFIEGTAAPRPEGLAAVDWAEGQPPLIGMAGGEISEGARCTLAIRPEKIAISQERPEDRNNVLQGTILDIGYLGNVSTYHVKLPGGQVIKAQTANTRRIARRGLTWEDEVWLSWTDTAGLVLTR